MIIYRQEKGSPLSIVEIDNNFRELDSRLNSLEGGESINTLSAISLEGVELVFKNHAGDEIYRAEMPMLTFNPTGVWQSNKQYEVYDLCTINKTIYYCRTSHISGVHFDDDLTNCVVMLEL